ncbi:hypothetical protein DFP72DRAFT_841606 [Ephemerocybe angulata]|uniref:Uncharacterized protein n=1 Tax=Ephemerocybe angulata TaxID=980116 RepID=A0A8H6IDG5_9AGAR|nr:hypothetical protein DFP72DRAFT_841606 [Tulosesus angulatus]
MTLNTRTREDGTLQYPDLECGYLGIIDCIEDEDEQASPVSFALDLDDPWFNSNVADVFRDETIADILERENTYLVTRTRSPVYEAPSPSRNVEQWEESSVRHITRPSPPAISPLAFQSDKASNAEGGNVPMAMNEDSRAVQGEHILHPHIKKATLAATPTGAQPPPRQSPFATAPPGRSIYSVAGNSPETRRRPYHSSIQASPSPIRQTADSFNETGHLKMVAPDATVPVSLDGSSGNQTQVVKRSKRIANAKKVAWKAKKGSMDLVLTAKKTPAKKAARAHSCRKRKVRKGVNKIRSHGRTTSLTVAQGFGCDTQGSNRSASYESFWKKLSSGQLSAPTTAKKPRITPDAGSSPSPIQSTLLNTTVTQVSTLPGPSGSEPH